MHQNPALKASKRIHEAAFLMLFPLFAAITVVLKFNLKTSIGGGILAKRRLNHHETASRWRQNSVSITAKRCISWHETRLRTILHLQTRGVYTCTLPGPARADPRRRNPSRYNLTLSPDKMPLSANKDRLFECNINSIGEGLLFLLMEDYYSYYGSDTIARQVRIGDNGDRVRSGWLPVYSDRRKDVVI